MQKDEGRPVRPVRRGSEQERWVCERGGWPWRWRCCCCGCFLCIARQAQHVLRGRDRKEGGVVSPTDVMEITVSRGVRRGRSCKFWRAGSLLFSYHCNPGLLYKSGGASFVHSFNGCERRSTISGPGAKILTQKTSGRVFRHVVPYSQIACMVFHVLVWGRFLRLYMGMLMVWLNFLQLFTRIFMLLDDFAVIIWGLLGYRVCVANFICSFKILCRSMDHLSTDISQWRPDQLPAFATKCTGLYI